MMREDSRVIEATIDELLREWHHWASHRPTTIGYPKQIPTRRLHTISRQWDTENCALDLQQQDELMFSVERCIYRLMDPYRTAIFLNARNLATGVSVWLSPRLPAEREERALIVADARQKVFLLFQSEGIA